MTNANDPAFIDSMGEGFKNGLTKREYFAGLALIARSVVPNGRLIGDYAKEAVAMADALIAELSK